MPWRLASALPCLSSRAWAKYSIMCERKYAYGFLVGIEDGWVGWLVLVWGWKG